MPYIVYPQLQNHKWLHRQLTKVYGSIAEMVADTGIPYNSINNQVKKMPQWMQDEINRGRLSWTEAEKRAILKQADLVGHSVLAREYDIAPAVLSRWRRELGIIDSSPLKRGRPPKIREKAS